MAIKNAQRGFTLLIAVIFMAVALSLGLSLASLAYKQEELASSALQSQSAFYAADSGLECALRADQQEDDFDYANYVPNANISPECGGYTHTAQSACYNGTTLNNSGVTCTTGEWVLTWKVPLAFPDPVNQPGGTETACAVVTIYKPSGNGTTYLFSQGYNTACANIAKSGIRFVSRGLSATYQD